MDRGSTVPRSFPPFCAAPRTRQASGAGLVAGLRADAPRERGAAGDYVELQSLLSALERKEAGPFGVNGPASGIGAWGRL